MSHALQFIWSNFFLSQRIRNPARAVPVRTATLGTLTPRCATSSLTVLTVYPTYCPAHLGSSTTTRAAPAHGQPRVAGQTASTAREVQVSGRKVGTSSVALRTTQSVKGNTVPGDMKAILSCEISVSNCGEYKEDSHFNSSLVKSSLYLMRHSEAFVQKGSGSWTVHKIVSVIKLRFT